MIGPKKQPIYYVVFFDIDYPSIVEAMTDGPEQLLLTRNALRSGINKGNWLWQAHFEILLKVASTRWAS